MSETSVHVTSRCHCKTFETTCRIIARHLSSGPTVTRGCHFAVRRTNEDQATSGEKEWGERGEGDMTGKTDDSKYSVFKYIHRSETNIAEFNPVQSHVAKFTCIRIIIVNVI